MHRFMLDTLIHVRVCVSTVSVYTSTLKLILCTYVHDNNTPQVHMMRVDEWADVYMHVLLMLQVLHWWVESMYYIC